MRFTPLFFATSAILAVTALPGAAMADSAQDYNLFVLNGMNVHSGDVEGRVAVGGNASLQSYSIGNHASSSGTNLVVGGNLTAHNGSTNGQTIVGGTTDYQGWSTAGLQPSGTALPVNFLTEATRLSQISDLLATYATNGTTLSPYVGQYVLTGAGSGLSVFDLDGTALANTNTLTINLTPGTTALINVSGTAGSFANAGITINGGNASDILWNFSDATTLGFSGISMLGSVLAPNADYLGGWGQLNGQLIVKSFSDQNGSTELHSGYNFTGNLLGLTPPTSAVPEPGSWALMIFGFGALGMAMRWRKRQPALA